MQEHWEVEEGEVDSLLRGEPDVGLDPRSWLEPKADT